MSLKEVMLRWKPLAGDTSDMLFALLEETSGGRSDQKSQGRCKSWHDLAGFIRRYVLRSRKCSTLCSSSVGFSFPNRRIAEMPSMTDQLAGAGLHAPK